MENQRKEGGKQTCLVPFGVHDVPGVESDDEPHAVCDAANFVVLSCGHGDVDDDPENQAWTHLVERFDVESPESGVKRTSNEPLRREG